MTPPRIGEDSEIPAAPSRLLLQKSLYTVRDFENQPEMKTDLLNYLYAACKIRAMNHGC